MVKKAIEKVLAKPAKAVKSLAKDFTPVNLFKIAVELTADEPVFQPVYIDSDAANVCALIPTLNHQGQQILRLNHRYTETVDCGISLTLPPGYTLVAKATRSYAQRGLLVSGCYLVDKRLKIIVTNVGHETPLLIGHKEAFAQIYLQPIYYFEWNK